MVQIIKLYRPQEKKKQQVIRSEECFEASVTHSWADLFLLKKSARWPDKSIFYLSTKFDLLTISLYFKI